MKIEHIKNKSLVALVTEDEHQEIKRRALEQRISVKDWMCRAIVLKMQMDDLESKKQK